MSMSDLEAKIKKYRTKAKINALESAVFLGAAIAAKYAGERLGLSDELIRYAQVGFGSVSVYQGTKATLSYLVSRGASRKLKKIY